MDNQLNIDKLDEFFITAKKGEIYETAIKHIERLLIEKALDQCFGNQIAAAKTLGLNRNTLRTKIKQLYIDVGRFK